MIGKPFPMIYRYVLERLMGGHFSDIFNKKIAMVGDSISTDILGAQNASSDIGCKVDGILVMSGITARDMKNEGIKDFSSETIMPFCKDICPEHAMSALDPDATVFF